MRVTGNELVPFCRWPGQGYAFLNGYGRCGIVTAAHGARYAEDVAGVNVAHHDLLAFGGGLYHFKMAVQQHEKARGFVALDEGGEIGRASGRDSECQYV